VFHTLVVIFEIKLVVCELERLKRQPSLPNLIKDGPKRLLGQHGNAKEFIIVKLESLISDQTDQIKKISSEKFFFFCSNEDVGPGV
jgi:hypothetical protein